MSDQHKCCAFAKHYLFSGERNGLALENKLKQNVIYRRSYTLRPTVKLEEKASNVSNKRSTNINNHKEANNICGETTNSTPIIAHLSPQQVCRTLRLSSGVKTESASSSAKSSNSVKPVIEAKPRAMNRMIARDVNRSEGKAPDARQRNARSASLPAIAVPLNSEDSEEINNVFDDCDHRECGQVMDQIRRRVSQIIESDVLAVKQKSEATEDRKANSIYNDKQKWEESSQLLSSESDEQVKNLEEYIEVKPMNKHSAKEKQPKRRRRRASADRCRSQRQESKSDVTSQRYDWNLDDFKSNDGLSDYLSEKIKRLSTQESTKEDGDTMARIAKRIRHRYLNILAKDRCLLNHCRDDQ